MAIEISPQEPVLPEGRQRERRALRRVCAWGGCAAIALAAVAITMQTESGAERIQLALEGPPARVAVVVPVPPVAPRMAEKDPDTKRLEEQVRTLAADRDRLTARLASVERNLEDVTGSIKRQAAVTPPPSAVPAPVAPAAAPAAVSAPPAVSAPAVSVLPVMAPLAMPASTGTAASWPEKPQPQPATTASEPVPMPPVRIAAAPANEPAAEPAQPRNEFGIDLGGASSIEALRARWAGVKANYGPLLAGLSPVAVRSRQLGIADFRLVVGPLPNAAAAARLCAQFVAAHATCRPAKFDGERIAQR